MHSLVDFAVLADVAGCSQAQPADESGTEVGHYIAVEVGHDHDVELGGVVGKLHAHRIDLLLGVLNLRILLGDQRGGLNEEPVAHLHHSCFVASHDSFPSVLPGVLEGVSVNILAGELRDNLQVLNHARHHLMLQPRVFALSVFSDGDQVHVVVWGLDPSDASARPDIGVELELLPEGYVEGSEALADGGLEWPLQPVSELLDPPDRFSRDKVSLCSLPLGVDLMVLELDGDLEG